MSPQIALNRALLRRIKEGFVLGGTMWDRIQLKDIENMMRDWEGKSLKGALEDKPERKEKFLTDTGLDIKRIYTPLDLSEMNFEYSLGEMGKSLSLKFDPARPNGSAGPARGSLAS